MTEKEQKLSPQEIHHGAFVSEGRMVAFPTCFPGASVPIVADESRITALDVSPEGDVYGGTSGKKTHLFAAMFRGVTGAIFDLGTLDKADTCVAVCCGQKEFFAFANGDNGGQAVCKKLQSLPFDLIQEWGFSRSPFEKIEGIGDEERFVHAVPDSKRGHILGTTENRLFVLDLDTKKLADVREMNSRGKIIAGLDYFWGLDEGNALWQYHLSAGLLERRAASLPKGVWDRSFMNSARDTQKRVCYVTDDEGRLFVLDEAEGFSSCLGQTPLAPVTALTVIPDGRVYGACGEEMQHLFVYDPVEGNISDLGIALSTIERRRHGYLFGDAVTGKDGEVYFGENDDLGHLWLYFPRILPRRKT